MPKMTFAVVSSTTVTSIGESFSPRLMAVQVVPCSDNGPLLLNVAVLQLGVRLVHLGVATDLFEPKSVLTQY